MQFNINAGSLPQREQERTALLAQLTELLEHDTRIVAAWLFGSLGRGNADAWSDLDIWLVVPDERIADFKAQRREEVAVLGEPLLLVEAPQNAPAGGAYLMACYDAPTGPLQVDWYWQAQSQAVVPPQSRLLFDHASIPHTSEALKLDYNPSPEPYPDPALPPNTQTLLRAANSLNFFWAMLCITAKYAARSPQEERMGLLPYVLGPLQDIRAFLNAAPASHFSDVSPQAAPHDKILLLRSLATEAETLHGAFVAAGGSVSPALAPSVQRLLTLVEASALASLPGVKK